MKFKSTEWFKIAGRGTVCSIALEESFYTNEVLNHEVMIDDKMYFVTAIEMFARHRNNDPVRGAVVEPGERVGFLIRGEK